MPNKLQIYQKIMQILKRKYEQAEQAYNVRCVAVNRTRPMMEPINRRTLLKRQIENSQKLNYSEKIFRIYKSYVPCELGS